MDARHATVGPDAPTLPRHRFTVDDVLAMQAAGVIRDGQVELLGGELVTMAAKKNEHELAKRRLVRWLAATVPHTAAVAVESTLYLSRADAPEPDIMIHPDRLLPEDVRGPDLDLLIEVAVESLAQDLGAKASLYARHGVRLYWVVDAVNRQVHVHEGPILQTGQWNRIQILSATEALHAPVGTGKIAIGDLTC